MKEGSGKPNRRRQDESFQREELALTLNTNSHDRALEAKHKRQKDDWRRVELQHTEIYMNIY